MPHTPAPWRVRLTTDGYAVLGAVAHKPHAYVALIPAEADARLIASAPAMLAALRAAEQEMAYRVSTRNSDALQQVRAAIAAATNTP